MDNTTEIQPPVQVVQRNAWLKVLAIAVDFYIHLTGGFATNGSFESVSDLGMVGKLDGPTCLCSILLRA